MRHISSLPKQKELARLYMLMTRTFIAHPSPLSSSSIRSFGINIISTSWWFIRYQTLSFVTINWTMSPFLKRRRGVSFFLSKSKSNSDVDFDIFAYRTKCYTCREFNFFSNCIIEEYWVFICQWLDQRWYVYSISISFRYLLYEVPESISFPWWLIRTRYCQL